MIILTCNKDCFNCPYPECIRDEQQDNRDNYNRYRAENLEKESERDRNRYTTEKEKRNSNNAKWQQEHKAERSEYMKSYKRPPKRRKYFHERYLANREKILQQSKENYQRKKAGVST